MCGLFSLSVERGSNPFPCRYHHFSSSHHVVCKIRTFDADLPSIPFEPSKHNLSSARRFNVPPTHPPTTSYSLPPWTFPNQKLLSRAPLVNGRLCCRQRKPRTKRLHSARTGIPARNKRTMAPPAMNWTPIVSSKPFTHPVIQYFGIFVSLLPVPCGGTLTLPW